jgi:hypothetical protein
MDQIVKTYLQRWLGYKGKDIDLENLDKQHKLKENRLLIMAQEKDKNIDKNQIKNFIQKFSKLGLK